MKNNNYNTRNLKLTKAKLKRIKSKLKYYLFICIRQKKNL